MVLRPTDVQEAFEHLAAFRDKGGGAAEAGPPLLRHELEPSLQAIGITRVGDLTDLDRIGLPVWSATRPASRSLCVSAGKGMTHEAAWTSAVLESCEQAMAEAASALTAMVDSPRGLARRGHRTVPLQRQSRCAAQYLEPDRDLAWVKGLSWVTGEPVYAPYELVGMDMVTSAPWNTREFRICSVGLASGRDLARAVTHGLLELIEDDVMFDALLPRAGAARANVTFKNGQSSDLFVAISKAETAGFEARFCRVSDDFSLPVMIAALVPRDKNRSVDKAYFCGSGCDTNIEHAALTALLEAAQCQALFTSGARDDLFEEEYDRRLTTGTERLLGRYDFVPAQDDGRVKNGCNTTMNEVVSTVTDNTGGDIYVFPLGGRKFGFEAVRVLADDLVSVYAPHAHARTGRAAGKLLGRWAHP